jgi:hypothetical protein
VASVAISDGIFEPRDEQAVERAGRDADGESGGTATTGG